MVIDHDFAHQAHTFHGLTSFVHARAANNRQTHTNNHWSERERARARDRLTPPREHSSDGRKGEGDRDIARCNGISISRQQRVFDNDDKECNYRRHPLRGRTRTTCNQHKKRRRRNRCSSRVRSAVILIRMSQRHTFDACMCLGIACVPTSFRCESLMRTATTTHKKTQQENYTYNCLAVFDPTVADREREACDGGSSLQ